MPQEAQNSGLPTGALPDVSSQQATVGSGLQIQQLLGQIAATDHAISNTLPQALAPVRTSGKTTGAMPGSFSFGSQTAPMAAPQGHKDARNQGIAKTISGVTNIVGQLIGQKKQEKQRALAVDIHRVMGAQDSMSEAKAMLKADPNDQNAKAALDKAKQIINDTIGADPKKLKQFEKAFDINLLDPSKNTADEHGAMKMASKSYADQLAAKTPDVMAPNKVAQAKVQALSAQRSDLENQVKTLIPAYNQQQRDQAAMDRTMLQQQEADARANANNQNRKAIADQTDQTRREVANQSTAERYAAAKLRSQTEFGTTKMRNDAAMDRTIAQVTGREKAAEKIRGTKPEQAAKLDAQNAKNMADIANKSAQNIANYIAVRDKIKDPVVKERYNKMIHNEEMNAQFATEWQKNYSMRTNSTAGGTVLDTTAKEGGKDGDSTSNKTTTRIIEPNPDDDDGGDEDSDDY